MLIIPKAGGSIPRTSKGRGKKGMMAREKETGQIRSMWKKMRM